MASGGSSDRGSEADRTRTGWERVRWPVTAAAVVVAAVLGWLGFAARYPQLSATDLLYRTLRLFVFEGGDIDPPVPWSLDVARFAAPAVAGVTAALALAAVFHDEIRILRARLWRHHVVVCGLGERGVLLAERFKDSGAHVACIELDESNPRVAQCRSEGMPVSVRDATDPDALRRVAAHRASIVVAVCQDDRVNAGVAEAVRGLHAARGDSELRCLAHVTDLELCDLLRRVAPPAAGRFRLALFNVHETGARMVLDSYPFRQREGIAPHVLVVGLGKMGRALVVNAAGRWNGEGKLRVTAIDRVATRKRELLLMRHPHLGARCDILALDLEKQSSEFERADYLFDPDGRPDTDAVYLCFEDDAHALTGAILLRHRLADAEVPVVVRLTGVGGLETLVPREPGLYPFGLQDRTCVPELLLATADATCAEEGTG